MFKHNTYVITDGPSGRTVQDIREQLEQQRIYACRLQNYRRITQTDEPSVKSTDFRHAFAHPTRLTIEFSPELVLPPANPYSVFTARVICHTRYACEPDDVAAQDPLLSILRLNPDITLDYICNRGIGIIQDVGWDCEQHRDHNITPLLLTTINLDALQDELKIIDLTGQARPIHLSTPHHHPAATQSPNGQINDPPLRSISQGMTPRRLPPSNPMRLFFGRAARISQPNRPANNSHSSATFLRPPAHISNFHKTSLHPCSPVLE